MDGCVPFATLVRAELSLIALATGQLGGLAAPPTVQRLRQLFKLQQCARGRHVGSACVAPTFETALTRQRPAHLVAVDRERPIGDGELLVGLDGFGGSEQHLLRDRVQRVGAVGRARVVEKRTEIEQDRAIKESIAIVLGLIVGRIGSWLHQV